MTTRPLSSHEIQRYYNRMPTRDERSAFSRWRAHNPTTCLTCGKDYSEEGVPGCATHEARKATAVAADEFRYLPASYRSLDRLQAIVGNDAADAIKELITDLIQEAMHPSNED